MHTRSFSQHPSSAAIQHYRNIFLHRSAEELKALAHIKRFMERLVGDPQFRGQLSEHIDHPNEVLARYGIEADAEQMLPLWRTDCIQYRNTPECAQWPLATLWDAYIGEMIQHRQLLREEGEMIAVNPRFHAWRARQMQRCNGELGASAESVTHPVLAFELSDGCTVGCWFCGLAADRYQGHFPYNEEHAELWQGILAKANTLFGPAVRTGFCYWATDPMDNPDYDRFLADYYRITGALPQTTTAAPLKDEALTRRVMHLFDQYRTVTNRFSVLTLKQLHRIHQAFTPEELMGVELVLQNREATTTLKATAGRAREHEEKLQAQQQAKRIAIGLREHTTIACVSGFLINMPKRRIQLVTPVPASERWPLGYRVVAERYFDSAAAFEREILAIIDEQMVTTPPAQAPLRFRSDLVYTPEASHFKLKSRNMEHRIGELVIDDASALSRVIAAGTETAHSLMQKSAKDSLQLIRIASFLDNLFEHGLLEEDLDDTWAYRQNEGLVSRRKKAGLPQEVRVDIGTVRSALQAAGAR